MEPVDAAEYEYQVINCGDLRGRIYRTAGHAKAAVRLVANDWKWSGGAREWFDKWPKANIQRRCVTRSDWESLDGTYSD